MHHPHPQRWLIVHDPQYRHDDWDYVRFVFLFRFHSHSHPHAIGDFQSAACHRLIVINDPPVKYQILPSLFGHSDKYIWVTECLGSAFLNKPVIFLMGFASMLQLKSHDLQFDAQKTYWHHFPIIVAPNRVINLDADPQAHKCDSLHDTFQNSLTHYEVVSPSLVNFEIQNCTTCHGSSIKSLQQNMHCVSQIGDKSHLVLIIIIVHRPDNSHPSILYA